MSEDSVTVMLQPTDNTEAILERVRTAGADRVSLIVPPDTTALQTLGGFTMLRKACDITGIDVTVYSADEKTCDMAQVCRFDVVHLDSEVTPPRAAPPEEEQEPRIVVSTKPPAPAGVAEEVVAAAEEIPERPAELEERLSELSEDDLALFDAFESMSSLTEEVEVDREASAPAAPVFAEEEEEAAAEVEPPREPRRRERAGPSVLQRVLEPIQTALGNIYIAFVSMVLGIAARFQARQVTPEAAPEAAVGLPERTEEQVRTRQAEKQRYYLWTLLAVIGFTILVLGVYLLSLPRAVVSLVPREAEAKEMDLALTILLQDAGLQEAKISEENGTIMLPAKPVQVELEGQASVEASGETWIPEGRATGAVVFTNRTEYAINVPSGSKVSGGGATFHTTQDIVVPASDFWGSDAYVGIARVSITADQPGSAGNVDAWVISTIEGELAGVLNVINEVPTGGGSERQGTVVTAEDQDKLRKKLVTELQEDAYRALQQELGSLEVLSGTLEIETIEEAFDHEVGSEADKVVLTARVRASALASRPGLLNQAIDKAVQQKMGEQKAGQKIASITHGAIEAVEPVQGINAWIYHTPARISIVHEIDEELKDEIRAALKGLPAEEADAVLAGYQDRIADYWISPSVDQLPGASRIRVVDISQHYSH